MKDIEINYLKKPKLENPVLIEGLPGIGHVGKLIAAHLIEELDCELFAEMRSIYFPPAVSLKKGVIEPIKIKFYYSKNPELIIIIGDSQANSSEGHYHIADKIIDIAEKFGTRKIITLGGYGVGKVVKDTPTLYGAATNEDLVEEYKKYGINFKESEVSSIVGAAGLLLSLATDKNLEGISILSETMGPPMMVDPRAAKAVLEALLEILNIDVDTSKLDKKAEKIEEKIEKIEKKVLKPSLKKGKKKPKENLWYIG